MKRCFTGSGGAGGREGGSWGGGAVKIAIHALSGCTDKIKCLLFIT